MKFENLKIWMELINHNVKKYNEVISKIFVAFDSVGKSCEIYPTCLIFVSDCCIVSLKTCFSDSGHGQFMFHLCVHGQWGWYSNRNVFKPLLWKIIFMGMMIKTFWSQQIYSLWIFGFHTELILLSVKFKK